MATQDRLAAKGTDQAEGNVSEAPETSVTAHQSSPDRVVFTEADNSDGWISTDTTVDLER